MSARTEFHHATEGLRQAVLDAANPAIPEWQPYKGSLIAYAVEFARLVVRMARRYGLVE